jgi:hypothetical protein
MKLAEWALIVTSDFRQAVDKVFADASRADLPNVINDTAVHLVTLRPSSTPEVDWVNKAAVDPVRVRNYLDLYGIDDPVCKTIALAEAHYPPGSKTTVSVDGDCESDEEWLIVRTAIAGERSRVFRLFNEFVDKWIDSIPSEGRDRIRITYTAR